MPSISPSSEITARRSLTRPKRTSAIAKMRPSSAASGPGTSSRSSLQERSAGSLPGSQPVTCRRCEPAVRRQREGDAVVVAGGAGAPDHAAAAEIDLVAADAQEGRHVVAVRRRAGAYAGPCVATGSHGLDAAEQCQRPADALAVELRQARAHEAGERAVAEARRRHGSAGCRCGSRRRGATG